MVGRCGDEAQLFGGEGAGVHERARDEDTGRGALPTGGVCAPALCMNST